MWRLFARRNVLSVSLFYMLIASVHPAPGPMMLCFVVRLQRCVCDTAAVLSFLLATVFRVLYSTSHRPGLIIMGSRGT